MGQQSMFGKVEGQSTYKPYLHFMRRNLAALNKKGEDLDPIYWLEPPLFLWYSKATLAIWNESPYQENDPAGSEMN